MEEEEVNNHRSTEEMPETIEKFQKNMPTEMGMRESRSLREIGKKIGVPGGELIIWYVIFFIASDLLIK